MDRKEDLGEFKDKSTNKMNFNSTVFCLVHEAYRAHSMKILVLQTLTKELSLEPSEEACFD